MIAGLLVVTAASTSSNTVTKPPSSKISKVLINSHSAISSAFTSSLIISSSSSETLSSVVSSDRALSSSSKASSRLAVSSKLTVSSKSKASSSLKVASSSAATSKSVASSSLATSSNQISSGTLSTENFTVKSKSNGVTITLPRHDLLCENVAWELGGGFSMETIKAQVIACYTNIKYCSAKGIPDVLLLSKEDAKTKWGNKYDTYWKKIDEAVTAVEGLYITRDTKNPIMAVFHVSCAGKTETATNVWGGTKDNFGNTLSYLSSVDSSWDYKCKLATNYKLEVNFTSDEIKKLALESEFKISLSGDPSVWFKIISLDSAGYVAQIQIGNATVTGRDVREKMLSLRSAAFTVGYKSGNFTFTTTGYGHGVGLSLYGAEYLSTVEGWNYSKILAYYYKGTTLKSR
jgi:stage II sporulation protein D